MTKHLLALVHGFMGDPSDWDLVRRELPAYEIATPLIRPASDWDAGVEQLATEVPAGSTLVGYSMGARLALALVMARPDAYAGLVFCSGNPGIEEDQQRATRYANDCQIANQIEREDRREFLLRWYTESSVFRSLSAAVREDEIARKAVRTGDDWSAILRTYSVARQPNFWPRLSELRIPVLAVAGVLDRKYARMVARMGTLPNIDARIVSACGHIVHREQPYVFLQLLREFLTTVP